ncbi:MAG TPA: EamA family transporter [Gemmatimonadales bacterium]|nr:EamA family transporter [Gemmatimonadales bacterium]
MAILPTRSASEIPPAHSASDPAGHPQLSLESVPPRRANPRIALLTWLCLCAIWGSTWLGIKLGLRDLPPLTFAGIRFALAAMVLGAIIALRRVRLPWAARDWRLLAYTGFLTITINYGLVFWGEQYIPSGLAALLSATVPLFGLPLAHRYLAAEPMTWRKVAGVLLGMLGVVIIFSGELGIGGPRALWASVGIMAAALATAHAGVLVKARGTHIEPVVLAGIQMAGGCIPLLVGGMALEGNPLGFHWTSLAFASLAYLTILGSVVAFLMYYWLIRHIEVTGVLMIPLVTPFVAVLIGVLFAGEPVGWHTVVGGGAIVAGVALAVLRVKKGKK